MFPDNQIMERLVRAHQEEIRREVRDQRSDPTYPAPGAGARLGKLIGLLVAAGWLISLFI